MFHTVSVSSLSEDDDTPRDRTWPFELPPGETNRGCHPDLRPCLHEAGCTLDTLREGPQASVAEVLATELGASDRVCFLGVVDRVAPILKDADLLILPSETESFGLAALEAMTSGVPVTANDIGGIPEVVEHGVSGYLAPVGDVDQMATYAVQLLSNCDLWEFFSAAERKRAVESSSYQRIVHSTRPSTSEC